MKRGLLGSLLLLLVAGIGSAAGQRETRRFDESFRKYAKRFFGVGFDWRLFKAQAMAESRLDPTAQSRAGARGIMQLMPSTFQQIQSRNPELLSINDPEWNIAAGIQYDRMLWNLWSDHPDGPERQDFMLGSYNAGRRTILRAQSLARSDSLDQLKWVSIEAVAPRVRLWRHQETLGYVRNVRINLNALRTR